MYNRGLKSFLDAKNLSPAESINAFLSDCGVTDFNHKNHDKVNDFIQKNWNRFSSFIDRAIKSGKIKGDDIRLNYSYEQDAERKQKIALEFKSLELTATEKKLLSMDYYEWGPVYSVLSKNGIHPPKKDMRYESKRLRFMPIIEVLREFDLTETALEAVNNAKTILK